MKVATYTVDGRVFRLTKGLNSREVIELVKAIGLAIHHTIDSCVIVQYNGYQWDKWEEFTHVTYTDKNDKATLCPNYFGIIRDVFETHFLLNDKQLYPIIDLHKVIIPNSFFGRRPIYTTEHSSGDTSRIEIGPKYTDSGQNSKVDVIFNNFLNLGIYTESNLRFIKDANDIRADLSGIVITELGYIKGIDVVALTDLVNRFDDSDIHITNTFNRVKSTNSIARPYTDKFTLYTHH